jgi:hypothetical protein
VFVDVGGFVRFGVENSAISQELDGPIRAGAFALLAAETRITACAFERTQARFDILLDEAVRSEMAESGVDFGASFILVMEDDPLDPLDVRPIARTTLLHSSPP